MRAKNCADREIFSHSKTQVLQPPCLFSSTEILHISTMLKYCSRKTLLTRHSRKHWIKFVAFTNIYTSVQNYDIVVLFLFFFNVLSDSPHGKASMMLQQ